MRHRVIALIAGIAVLALTAYVDSSARSAHTAEVRAEVSARADALARGLSDVVVRESAAVETLSAFVEITASDSERLSSDFPVFASALMDVAPKIRSVQLGPDSILEFVYPLSGNEQAVGLDLLADPDRLALLGPAIVTGETVIQGPVELVQGGLGLIVRRPVYRPDESFWGFAAIVLDWPAIAAETGLVSEAGSMSAGLMREGLDGVIAGSAEVFGHDPVIRTLQVGATATTWTLAMEPSDGWPTTAPTTSTLWISGALISILSTVGLAQLLERPEALKAERENALRDLALAEARYKATFQHAGVGIVVTDAKGMVVSANRALRRIVDLGPSDDFNDLQAGDFVHPEDLGEITRIAAQVIQSGDVGHCELRLVGEQGERWCKVQVTILRHETTQYFVGVVEDITSARAAESALAESEARYRHLFQETPVAIQRQDFSRAKQRLDEFRAAGVTDLEALLEDDDTLAELVGLIRITDANPAAISLNSRLGSDPTDLRLDELVTDDARCSFVSNFLAIWNGDEFVSIPVSPTTFDGHQLHLELRWQPAPMAGGLDYSQVMVTVIDVTHLTDVQRRLEDLLASKDRFLASVAHELRTPLTAVVGFAQELRDDAALSVQDRREFVSLVAQNSVEMSHLIEDILVIARAEIGEVKTVPGDLDVATEVKSVLKLLPDHGLALKAPEKPVLAFADPSRVRQIVRNLVTNALRYGGSDVSVEIGTFDGRAFVDVGDDGPPLSPAEMARIFEPYQRLTGSASAPGSIGLGLTVSRALARIQGGDVDVRRESDRNIFRLVLPIDADR